MLPTRQGMRTQNRGSLGSGFSRSMIAENGILPHGLQLIQDSCPFKVIDKKNIVIEDANGRESNIMKVTGLIQNGDTENANGRYYPTNEVLAPAVKAIQEDMANRAVLGEYDHPNDAKLHLDRASHLMSKVWMDGKKVYGEAEILHKLPHGAALRGLFEHKVRVGISSRGVGDMEISEHNGREIFRVLEGYQFVTWDAVAEPSVSGAILNIQESLQRRTKPAVGQKKLFSEEAYQKILVGEIERFLNVDRPKKISRTTRM